MSHDITETDKVFTVGETAWHGLDINHQGPRLTAEQAREFLNWTVKKVPALYEDKPVDGAYYTVREDTDAVLGVVGSQYSVIQNDWLFRLLEPVVNDGACLYETGGSLMGGRKVWALAKLRQAHYIVKDDRVDQYILVTIAHDGSLMFTALYTDVRVVCNNTLTTALNIGGGANPVVRIKHTPGYRFQAQIAHKILGLSTKASAQAATFFAELAAKSMNSVELTQFAKFLFPSVRENEGKEAIDLEDPEDDGHLLDMEAGTILDSEYLHLCDENNWYTRMALVTKTGRVVQLCDDDDWRERFELAKNFEEMPPEKRWESALRFAREMAAADLFAAGYGNLVKSEK